MTSLEYSKSGACHVLESRQKPFDPPNPSRCDGAVAKQSGGRYDRRYCSSARKSDHNPNENNVVTAMDITHDPVHGVDAGAIAEMLRLSKDPRIKYVISNRRIFSSLQSPWQWRHTTGANAHTKHVHVSVLAIPALCDDTKPWTIDKVARIETPPVVAGGSSRCIDITATVFGGRGDPNNSAYDNHFITDEEFGAALPDRITVKPRPKVRVTHSQTRRSVICDIVDVGPWNIRRSLLGTWRTTAGGTRN